MGAHFIVVSVQMGRVKRITVYRGVEWQYIKFASKCDNCLMGRALVFSFNARVCVLECLRIILHFVRFMWSLYGRQYSWYLMEQ